MICMILLIIPLHTAILMVGRGTTIATITAATMVVVEATKVVEAVGVRLGGGGLMGGGSRCSSGKQPTVSHPPNNSTWFGDQSWTLMAPWTPWTIHPCLYPSNSTRKIMDNIRNDSLVYLGLEHSRTTRHHPSKCELVYGYRCHFSHDIPHKVTSLVIFI